MCTIKRVLDITCTNNMVLEISTGKRYLLTESQTKSITISSVLHVPPKQM